MGEIGRARGSGRARARVAGAVVLLVCSAALQVLPAQAQLAIVVAEQWLVGNGSGGLVSANLDPARRYSLQVLPAPDGTSFRGNYSQNWFARDGARRAGSSEVTLAGRAPWEQELPLPAPALAQWTFAAGIWNDGSGTLLVRLIDHGPR